MKNMYENFAKIVTRKFCNISEREHDVYVSTVDGSYLGHVSKPERLDTLIRFGVTEQVQNSRNDSNAAANIGFNPVENKWYGWSHRAIYGFGIGSTCKKGDCHFIPSTREEEIQEILNFWADECRSDMAYLETVDEQGEAGLQITWVYNDKTPDKRLVETVGGVFSHFRGKLGRGEWVAETIEDAKQMAIDFAEEIG